MLWLANVLLCAGACECSSGVCCDGCHYIDGGVCDDEPKKVWYDCVGSLCGGTLMTTYAYAVCDGKSPDCSHVITEWSGELIVDDECSYAERCFDDGKTGYCYVHEWCCQPDCSQAECGDDGCEGSCGSCPEGLTCALGTCVEPKPLCESCFKSYECAEDYGCYGYDDIGGMCLPMGCVIDGDCPKGMICWWFEDGTSACWVQKAGTVCVEDNVWQTNTCFMPYYQLEKCGDSQKKCFNGKCCAPQCDDAVCGDDGCGGECGSCGVGAECEHGWCVACEPGHIDRALCESECAEKIRVCDPYGAWGDWSMCFDAGRCEKNRGIIYPLKPHECAIAECSPGEVIASSCEKCGTQTTVCNIACVWVEGFCVNQKMCEPGEEMLCEQGKETKVCSEKCVWGPCLESDRTLVDTTLHPLTRSRRNIDVAQGCGMHHSSRGSLQILLVYVLIVGVMVSRR